MLTSPIRVIDTSSIRARGAVVWQRYAYGIVVGIGLAHGLYHVIDLRPSLSRGRSYADGIAVGIETAGFWEGAVPRIGDVVPMPTAAVGISTPRISDVACGDMPTAARLDRRHRFDGVSR